MEKYPPYFTDKEHAWAAKHLRPFVAKCGVSEQAE